MPFEKRDFGFNGFKREMHKATCADCKQECEVPFKPDGSRQSTVKNVIKNMHQRDSNPRLSF